MGNKEGYWDKRARMFVKYRGESFYTITPIPYYYRRRKIILNQIGHYIKQQRCKSVCDFACGDGVYIDYLQRLTNTGTCFYGVDASAAMIDLARQNCQGEAEFEVSQDGIKNDRMFDVIYSTAVFAHLSDETVVKLLTNLYEHLNAGGGTYTVRTSGTASLRGENVH